MSESDYKTKTNSKHSDSLFFPLSLCLDRATFFLPSSSNWFASASTRTFTAATNSCKHFSRYICSCLAIIDIYFSILNGSKTKLNLII